MPSGTASEAYILSAIRLAANDEPGLVLWRLSQGGAVTRGGKTYRAGLSVNGASDLVGVLRMPDGMGGRGRFVALEVKAARGHVQREQELFLDVVRRHGGFAAVVRSVDDFRAAVERARNGESQ